jgi:hypothetical protein
MKRLTTIPYAFVLMNWAAITALLRFVRHHGEDLWQDAWQRPSRPAVGSSLSALWR